MILGRRLGNCCEKWTPLKPLIGRLTDDGFNLTPFYLRLVKSGAGHLSRIVCERGCCCFIIPTVPRIPTVPIVLNF